jgi:outer membrane receptor protein involved in Fe transport
VHQNKSSIFFDQAHCLSCATTLQKNINEGMKKVNVIIGLLFAFLISVYGQQQSVTGRVVNTNGETLPGVNVIIKSTTTGTTTDARGEFKINVKDVNTTLTFSYLGYRSKELVAKNKMTVILQEDAKSLNEVVVSAQKRLQSSIDVPATISALSGNSLVKLNVQQLDELSEYIPGMQMQLQSPNNPGYVIRGVTSDDGDSRSQPRVSVFQDGVSISRSRASVVELFDLERIEVVKGPQGTLFGRGAEIGALHLIRKKPTDLFSAEITAGYGTWNQKLLTGFLNTPIVSSKLLNRFAFNYNERDGFIKNLSGGDLNGKSVLAFRNSTRWNINKKTTSDLILDYQYDNYPGTSFKSKQYAPKGGDTDPNSMADLEQGENLYIKRHVGGAALLIDHNINDRLKFSSISGFRAFHSDESFDADGTVAPILWLSEIAQGKQFSQEFRLNYDDKKRFSGFAGASYFYESNSQEVPMRINEQSLYIAAVAPRLRQQFTTQFQSLGMTAEQATAIATSLFPVMTPVTNGQANFVTKFPDIRKTLEQVFSAQYGVPVKLEQALAGLPAAQRQEIIGQIDYMSNHSINSEHEESYKNRGINTAAEVFADGTYSITKALKLTAGLRFTYENQTGYYQSDASAQPGIISQLLTGTPNLLAAISDGEISATKDYWSGVGRLALNYMFKRNNFYVSVSRGRRPGVISILPSKTTYLEPEIIWSYEAGLKGQIADSKLNYDIAAYYYDWSHFQTTSLQPVEGTIGTQFVATDAGKAHSMGLETGLKYIFSNALNVFVNYAYIDGKFNDKDENGDEQEYAGNTFRLTPKHSFSVGIDATFALAKGKEIFIRPAYSYKSKVFFEDDNTDLLSQDGYGLLNYTAGIRIPAHKLYYEISTYAKNALDQKYIIDAGNTGNTIGMPTFIGGSRSQFGVQLKVGF